jgi:chromosome segregation ATPase
MGLFKKKPTVDSADILLLHSEIAELKERLEASEQNKVVLEDRLSSIAATTMILSNTAQSNTAEIVEQIESIHGRLDNNDEVNLKVDELHQRVIEVESRAPVSELPEASDVMMKLAALSGRLEAVAQLAAAPAQPDDELAARLEQLSSSAETVEALNRQFSTLSARVNAQAEMADQLRALSERISLLQQRSVDNTDINERIEQLSMAAPMTDELGERVVDLAARVAASEQLANEARAKSSELEQKLVQVSDESTAELRAQLAALSGRIEAHDLLTQQLVELEGRLDAQDERTSQLAATAPSADELTARLDELAARLAASEVELRSATERAAALEERVSGDLTADIESRLGELSSRVEAQSGVEERLTQIDGKLGELDARDLDVRRIHELLDQLRANTPSNDRVNEQLAELSQRVEASEAAAAAVRDHANALDERFGQLDGRIGDVDGRLGQVADRANELDQLRERIDQISESLPDAGRAEWVDQQIEALSSQLTAHASLPDQLAALNTRVSEVQGRGVDVDRIFERLDQLATAMPSTDGLLDEINRLAERVASSEGDARSARDQAAALEERLGNISTELANQLGELSQELDHLATLEPVGAHGAGVTDDEAVAALKASQVKLATEQARYEITFREDLAALAEQVRQLRGRS